LSRPVPLIAALCAAEILGMAGSAAFPALLPTFQAEWRIDNTDAGWISGIYYAGYLGAVPVLVSLTDRVDPRRIYLFSMALSGLALLAFALVAEGFWTALLLRALAGIGLAGTYMPGLKALSDRIEGPMQSRALAFYTSSFGVGSSLSFVLAGELEIRLGWQWAFGLSSLGPLAAILLALSVLRPAPPPHHAVPDTRLLDFRPVLGRREAMAYILAYCAHNWELFCLRSWIVAFFAFSRVGRRRLVILIMSLSALIACLVGFAATLPFVTVFWLILVYGIFVTGDSASITAGAVANAPPGYRGATMAMHACIGFTGAFLGPLAVGVVLDLSGGGATATSWGLAFMTFGLGAAMGPLALLGLGRRRG
jgi:MFS family permease